MRNTSACCQSVLLLSSLPASPAYVLSIGIINFFVPHITPFLERNCFTSPWCTWLGETSQSKVMFFHAALSVFYVPLRPSGISWPYSIQVWGRKNHCILKCWLHQMATRLEDSNHAGLRRLKTHLENWCLLSLYRKKWIRKENNKEGHTLILLCSG